MDYLLNRKDMALDQQMKLVVLNLIINGLPSKLR